MFPEDVQVSVTGELLPSPCGDEVFLDVEGNITKANSYRPLAGMRCFIKTLKIFFSVFTLPSPCGDEVFRAYKGTDRVR